MLSMRSSTRAAGLTLVELLIVSPLVILTVAVMIGFAVNMTGDVLITRERTQTVYTAQAALDRIEQDIRVSTSILPTSGTLPSPQGRNSTFTGTSAFANPAIYLVLEQYATTGSPYYDSRELVYYANSPNACSAKEYNTPMQIKVIYYLDDTTLRRRTVVPPGTVCDPAWQRNSCKNNNSSGICRARDEVIAEGVSSLAFTYYQTPGGTSAISPPDITTRTVLTTISITKEAAGRSVSSTSVMRATTAAIK